MSEKLGYMWYPKDFISDPDVMMMSSSERGIYRDLLDLAYLNDNKLSFPINQLARYCNDSEENVLKMLERKATKLGGKWVFDSCEKRLVKTRSNRENGAKGGRPKKPKQNPNDNPNETQAERQIESKREIEIKNFIEAFNSIRSRYLQNTRGYAASKKTIRQLDVIFRDGFSIEDLKTAVSNAFKDKYHADNSWKWVTPEYITRDDQFSKWLNAVDTTPKYNPAL